MEKQCLNECMLCFILYFELCRVHINAGSRTFFFPCLSKKTTTTTKNVESECYLFKEINSKFIFVCKNISVVMHDPLDQKMFKTVWKKNQSSVSELLIGAL